jgi:hypothetical protein
MQVRAGNWKGSKLLGGLALVLMSCQACGHQADPDAALKGRLAELRRQTTPPTAPIDTSSGPVRSQFSVAASWEFETEWDWKTYSEWVKSELSGFEIIRRNDPEIVFARPVGGDTESIAVRRVSNSRPLRVQVTFRMYPQ